MHPEQRLVPTGKEGRKTTQSGASYITIECTCSCGTVKWIRRADYNKNVVKSCGCLNQEKRKSRTGDKNGRFKHGLVNTPLHMILHTIKTKCTNPNFEGYHGGSISVCQEWLDDFIKFYNWALKNGWQEGLCISRKDYTKDYSPDNCYITTREEVSNKEEIKTKIHESNKSALMEKYGVEYARDIPGVDEKIRKTNIERYGSESPLGNKDIQQKAIDTNIRNYGQPSVPFEVYKDKFIATNRERHGVDYPPQNKEITRKGVETRIKRGLIYMHEGLGAEEWAKKVGVCAVTMRNRIRQVGFEEAIKIPKRQTGIEYKVQQLLDKYSINYIFNKKLGNRYPDFRLEEHKLIVEVDGLYWHSDAVNKDRNYHIKKKQEYKELGYDCIFFREDEVLNKIEIIESILLNKLGKTKNRIFARKTKIEQIKKSVGSEFFNTNHLMGRGGGDCYGLFYENELVCAIRVREVKGYIDISRFCNKLNNTVIGGFSKLLNYIINKYNRDIHTFIDMRYGQGEYLSELGFTKTKEYPSFKWVSDNKVVGRQTFKANTGYEHGYYKLWDAGQALWEKKIPVLPG